MSNLKLCTVEFSISYNSFEDVASTYAAKLKDIPKEATKISSCFEVEEEYGCTHPILVISYYLPKTFEELAYEKKKQEAIQAQKLETYLKLKAEFKDA